MTNNDAISREWIKIAIHNFYYGLKHTPTEEDIQAYIDTAPSVSVESTAYWIEHMSNGLSYIECSNCHSWFKRLYLTRNSYCPNCGRKMVKIQEREEITCSNYQCT